MHQKCNFSFKKRLIGYAIILRTNFSKFIYYKRSVVLYRFSVFNVFCSELTARVHEFLLSVNYRLQSEANQKPQSTNCISISKRRELHLLISASCGSKTGKRLPYMFIVKPAWKHLNVINPTSIPHSALITNLQHKQWNRLWLHNLLANRPDSEQTNNTKNLESAMQTYTIYVCIVARFIRREMNGTIKKYNKNCEVDTCSTDCARYADILTLNWNVIRPRTFYNLVIHARLIRCNNDKTLDPL